MNFFALSAIVNAFTSLILGTLVIFQGRNRTYSTFSLFAFAVALWSIFYFQWQQAGTAIQALLWSRLLMAAAAFIPFFYYHFIVAFLDIERRQRLSVFFGYGFALFFSIASFSPLLVTGVSQKLSFSFWPNPGPLYSLFLLIWFFYVILGTILLFERYHRSQGEIRAQIKLILFGMIVGYLGGATNYFLWYGVPIQPFGNILVSFYVIMVTYAILHHRLFNMKVIASELTVFALWLFMFIRMLLSNSVTEQFINGSFFLVVLVVGTLLVRSVDKEVEQRERIQKLAGDLQETNERQEELMHFIGHEVKGFLAKDEGAFAAISQGDFGVPPDGIKSFVEQALTQSRNSARSVTDLLLASNQKKGTISYVKEPFDLKPLMVEAVGNAKSAAMQKGLSLSFVADDSSYQMSGDKAQISDHVLRNLIDNAINYTPSGSIIISLKKEDRKIIFSVKDSGIGITEEDKKRLFTEGGHGKDSQKVNVHSTGYGLYIAKNIITAHGGTIRAESEGEGKGATFIVELPA
ncbi:MAG TPA: ATP-binding protein [Candidatus Paceibacterota bacterium]|nr:ATP-binding protein [Candidatus Paceibacterota bacterium]